MEYSIVLFSDNNKKDLFHSLITSKKITNKLTTSGNYIYDNNTYYVIDAPSSNSLLNNNERDIIARNYLCFNTVDLVLINSEIESLEKNLCLLFSVLDYHNKILLLINTTDKEIDINHSGLMNDLGIPIIYINSSNNTEAEKIKESIALYINSYEYKPILISYDKLINKKKAIYSKLHFTNNKELLSKRILDANNSFFNTYYEHYPDEKIYIEFLREYIETKKNSEYIIKKNLEVAQKVISRNIINNISKNNPK